MDKPRLPEKMQDFLAQTRKSLLLFLENPDLLQSVQQQLQASAFHLAVCKSQQAALDRIRTTVNRQILLEDCPASQTVLAEIANWPGHTRRFTHLVLLGQRGKSLDSQIAFTLGVDSYIHIQDSKRLGTLFQQSQKIFFSRNKLWVQEGNDF